MRRISKMRRMRKNYLKACTITALLAFILIILPACSSHNRETKDSMSTKSETTRKSGPGPKALVYKTKADYHDLVPVILSDDKSKIVSYPHPGDVKIGDNFPEPTELNNGYLLDNRGIGKNVAFLNITYKDYSQLEEAPSLSKLNEMIKDRDPLVELCDCGSKWEFKDIKNELNSMIDSNVLRERCKVIK